MAEQPHARLDDSAALRAQAIEVGGESFSRGTLATPFSLARDSVRARSAPLNGLV